MRAWRGMGLACALPFLNGCIVISPCCWSGLTSARETLDRTMDAMDCTTLEVETPNGEIVVVGEEGVTEIRVHAELRARGRSASQAQERLTQIQVETRRDGGRALIGWSADSSSTRCNASVNFEIHVPRHLAITGRAQNGSIRIERIMASVNVATHNGGIRVEHHQGPLTAETYNGAVSVASSTREVRLATYNGRITAAFEAVDSLTGSVKTYNGSVHLSLPPGLGTRLSARTTNGTVRCSSPGDGTRLIGRSITAGWGQAPPSALLRAETYNGSIVVE